MTVEIRLTDFKIGVENKRGDSKELTLYLSAELGQRE